MSKTILARMVGALVGLTADWGTDWGTGRTGGRSIRTLLGLVCGLPCRPATAMFAVPRGPRLDALPLFVRTLRSRSSPGIFDPALRPGSLTGVLHHVMLRGIKGRSAVRWFGCSVVPRAQGTQATQRSQ
jgi:hypothetical protein